MRSIDFEATSPFLAYNFEGEDDDDEDYGCYQNSGHSMYLCSGVVHAFFNVPKHVAGIHFELTKHEPKHKQWVKVVDNPDGVDWRTFRIKIDGWDLFPGDTIVQWARTCGFCGTYYVSLFSWDSQPSEGELVWTRPNCS